MSEQTLPGAPIPEENQPGHHPDREQDRPTGPGPWRADRPDRFRFRFNPATLVLGVPFGITPWTTWLTLTGGDLFIRYGPWSLRTPLSNISGAELTGPYNLVKVAGPPHVSLADRGLSFATAPIVACASRSSER